MSFDEKYQAGEAYGEAPKPTPSGFFSDPVAAATAILRDYAGARCEATLPQLINLIKSLTMPDTLIDDRKGNTELLIAILTSLPPNSATGAQLTNKMIDSLWGNLQHPPLSYVGGDVKYRVANTEEANDKTNEKYDKIEFEVPGTGITLSEEVPKAPNGMHHYRMPDGSFNNILQPDLGKAGSAYAKSVRSSKRLHGVRPDAGQLFDLLMARGDDTFRENPAGISSMLFYFASIIIHDIFRTSRTDMNKSDTSSYLDLAPLYGSSLRDQLKVRTMKEGMLKPDTFHEKRLLGQPAGVNVMLVLFNRFHNYVANVLLKINEGDRFTLACSPKASPEDRAKALAKQDHDLFNTARLIVCAMYGSIALGDYLRAIMNLHSSNTEWNLDPRMEIGKQYDGEGVPRGVGNQVSVEFNLLYRFHSCISKKDEQWTNEFFLKLFPERKSDNLQDITLPELGKALLEYEKSIPTEPCERTFGGLERLPNGRFKDEDLVRILNEATQDPAGTFGARMVPKALKIVEILGINQARKWGCASLNEFREFFGLKPYKSFTDINPDEYIAKTLEQIYTHPDMVEMYPGMIIEDTKPMRSPGVGISPTYTIGRAVLADAITLIRSDRFLTLDFNVANLTAWGMNEVQGDPKTLGGSMLYKLIHRGLPGWFPFNSVSIMQPMYTTKANIEIAKKLGTIDLFSLDGPESPKKPVLITTPAGIKQVLGNPKSFPSNWGKYLNMVKRGKDISWYMLAGDEPKNYENRKMTAEAFKKLPNLTQAVEEMIARVGKELIEKESFNIKEGVHQIDIIRDVAIPLNTRLASDMCYFDLRTDENPDGKLGVAQLYRALVDMRVWITNNTDPAENWNKRRRAGEGADVIIPSTRALVEEVALSRGVGIGISAALSKMLTRQAHHRKDSLRSYGFKYVETLLGQGHSRENVTDQLWLTAFGLIGVLVTTFYEILEFFLRPENQAIWAEVQELAHKGDTASLRGYVAEAQRLTSPFRVVRYPKEATEVEGKKVDPSNVLILNIADIARNEVLNPTQFDPIRKQPEITGYSWGQHECFGKQLAITFMTGMIKLVGTLKNLRPAPGAQGQVKSIIVGPQQVYLNDTWSHLTSNVSTWKVQYDGLGKGGFEGSRSAADDIAMQEYYEMLRLRKGGAKK
ncbi:Hypothetical protein R9X50_00660600 [Acrodontium crateriforme]|uniref:Linoleate 8R-lipoxygenase n=1 Tax=Acrodontium crateriforme TaxID=150365 RepID=A0AAQ3MAD7_9PEZI|nr:Hypothetical protein R9X50_00660600 [Acrodontium crateriforme]